MVHRVYAPKLKAQVLAALAGGESAHRAADRFDVPRTTVRRWRRELWAHVHVAGNGPQKKEGVLGDQLLCYLEESIATQRAQATFMRDPEWLLKQNAAGLAMLFGTVFDKTERLLGNLQSGGGSERA